MSPRKSALFLGRWQPPHLGHEAILETAFRDGLDVLLLVRDVPPDEGSPLTADAVAGLWRARYAGDDRVVVRVVPDVVSIRYGRTVGYEVEEVEVSPMVARISATEIRRQIRAGEVGWRALVHPRITGAVEEALT